MGTYMSDEQRNDAGETRVILDPRTGSYRTERFWVYNGKRLSRADLMRLPPLVRLDICNGSKRAAGL